LRRMLWEPPWCCVALAVIAIFLVFLWFSFPVTPWSYGQLVNILPTNENRRPAIAGSFKKKTSSYIRLPYLALYFNFVLTSTVALANVRASSVLGWKCSENKIWFYQHHVISHHVTIQNYATTITNVEVSIISCIWVTSSAIENLCAMIIMPYVETPM
jgi:hypothetical protein